MTSIAKIDCYLVPSIFTMPYIAYVFEGIRKGNGIIFVKSFTFDVIIFVIITRTMNVTFISVLIITRYNYIFICPIAIFFKSFS